MARPLLVSACLLATFLVAGAMPVAGGPADNLAAKGPACTKSGDDSGMGGTHVSCRYSCPKAAMLSIAVRGTDPDADTYGDTACGGAAATCGENAPACLGVSEGPSDYSDPDAGCSGSTDEWFDSPMTVACAATGVDPCFLIEDLCDFSPEDLPPCLVPCDEPTLPEINPCKAQTCGLLAEAVRKLCEAASPDDERTERLLAPLAGVTDPVLGYAAADWDGDTLASLVLTSDLQMCTFEEIAF